MGYNNIKLEIADGAAVLTIERPSAMNALNNATLDEIDSALSEVLSSGIKGMIVTGSGPKAFVAGADISEIKDLNPDEAKLFSQKGQRTFRKLETLGIPVIAAVNGYALGGGCELAMACTVRTASTNAVFGLPEVSLGLIPGYGGTQRLSRLIGKGRAMEMTLTGRMVKAEEALSFGLVCKVCEPDKLMDETLALLASITKHGPLALKYAMTAVNDGAEIPFDEAQLIEAGLFAAVCGTEDMKEGTSAFLEKRKPVFTGK